MSRKFQIKTVPSSWLEHNGRRLDCGPYLSGAMEARELLRRLPAVKELLSSITMGIYHAGRESRLWVETDEYGVPFMGSTDVLASDLSNLPLISKKQVRANPNFTIRPGWTLITRSGTIGRMAYARNDMDGVACSEHVMRVVPDTSKVKPGYIYAYMSSKFGLPIVLSGTYGSIIQSIEPQHIADLPVPRLSGIEEQAHLLIEEAASCRDKASAVIEDAIRKYERLAGLPELPSSVNGGYFGIRTVRSSALRGRLDGLFHSAYHNKAIDALSAAQYKLIRVADIASSLFEPLRSKRVQIDDPEFGLPFFGTSELMWAEPVPKYMISKRQEHIESFVVTEQTVLIPRSGQLSGIIGTPVLPYGAMIGGAVSEHAIRIHCKSATDAGFLFIALKSEYGRRQLKSRAYGSSIPTLDVNQVGNVQVPDIGDEKAVIGQIAVAATHLRHKAIDLEKQAIQLVEKAIEEGSR